MNKSELIDAIAAKVSELPKKAVGEMLNAFTATVGEALKKGDDIALIGFGRFSVKELGRWLHGHGGSLGIVLSVTQSISSDSVAISCLLREPDSCVR
jgi:hypothetical protein